MGKIADRLTYANVMATVAVFVALGGGAWALTRNSVGAPQIKPNAVRSSELKNDAVKGKDVRESTLDQVPNADTLDGKDSSELETSSAATAGLAVDVPLAGVDQTVTSTTITTTSANSRVIAVASLELDGDQAGADDRGRCFLRIAGVDGPPYLDDVPASGVGRSTIALTFAGEVGPGTHDVALLCGVASGVVDVEEANLSAWAVGA